MVLSSLGMRPSRGKKHTSIFYIFACYAYCGYHFYLLFYVIFIEDTWLFILNALLIQNQYKIMKYENTCMYFKIIVPITWNTFNKCILNINWIFINNILIFYFFIEHMFV